MTDICSLGPIDEMERLIIILCGLVLVGCGGAQEKSVPSDSNSKPKVEQSEPEQKAVLGPKTGKRSTAKVVEEIGPSIQKMYPAKKLAQLTDGGEILLVAIKDEQRLELWKKARGAKRHTHIIDFPWTATSGVIGPKLKEGDRQIPEGVYRLEYLNPNSRYHLSMKIDYPNAFDRARGKEDGRKQLGGDIMIHGRAVTVGCIPLGDPAIEHLFYLVAENGFKNVRVIIAPTDFRKGNPAPEIANISWESELYEKLSEALREVTGDPTLMNPRSGAPSAR